MQEEQIVQSLARKLPKAEVPVQGYPQQSATSEEDEDEESVYEPIDNMLLKQQLLEYFELPKWTNHSPEIQQQISEIAEWAIGQHDNPNLVDILQTIRDHENMLGSRFNENRLSKLHNFVKIRQQMNLLAKKEQLMYA